MTMTSTNEHTVHQGKDGTWSIAIRAAGPRVILAEVHDEGLRAETIMEVREGDRRHIDLHQAHKTNSPKSQSHHIFRISHQPALGPH